MKEIGDGKKQLFRYHIEQNIVRRNTGNLFQFRANRWRLSTYDKPKLLNQMRFGGPILFSLLVIIYFGRTR